MITYDNKIFKVVSNSENGEVSSEMKFHYKQEENIVSCSYHSNTIRKGHLIALVTEDGSLDMRYHQINAKGEFMTGICQSKPEILPNGKIRLHESWRWTSGDMSEGVSVLDEE